MKKRGRSREEIQQLAEAERRVSVAQVCKDTGYTQKRIFAALEELDIPAEEHYIHTNGGRQQTRAMFKSDIPRVVSHIEKELGLSQKRDLVLGDTASPLQETTEPYSNTIIAQLQSEIAFLRATLAKEQEIARAALAALNQNANAK